MKKRVLKKNSKINRARKVIGMTAFYLIFGLLCMKAFAFALDVTEEYNSNVTNSHFEMLERIK